MAKQKEKTLLYEIVEELKNHTKRTDGVRLALNEYVLNSLINAFQNGANGRQAHLQAGITHTTFNRYYKMSPTFASTMDRARNFVALKAQKAVREAVEGVPAKKRMVLDNKANLVEVEDAAIPPDVNTAKWFLGRTDERFKEKSEVTTKFDDAPQSADEEEALAGMLAAYKKTKDEEVEE